MGEIKMQTWLPVLQKCMDSGLYVYPLRESKEVSSPDGSCFRVVLPAAGDEKFREEVKQKLLLILSAFTKETDMLFHLTEVEYLSCGIQSVYVGFRHRKHQ